MNLLKILHENFNYNLLIPYRRIHPFVTLRYGVARNPQTHAKWKFTEDIIEIIKLKNINTLVYGSKFLNFFNKKYE